MTEEFIEKYHQKRADIERRLSEFKSAWQESDEFIFAELAFCLLTPQSKAKTCWRAITKLKESGLLYSGDEQQIKAWLAGVRFYNEKAKHVIKARELFSNSSRISVKDKIEQFNNLHGKVDSKKAREWLVKNVKGFGYKEASHFLRNVGFYEDVAILDRHILKNLLKYGAIVEIPKSLTPKKYMEIEEKMKEFAERSGIPFAHLDLLFWSEETGEIFK
ncbi:MAG: N-glycosylase/DNA lyase [Candidatus Aenigmarchaeota archaeon]|nr:N-glycosylase/DNA lyase [Candidatus Aenigmarchaeota archaeon]